jgi:hypothetical protein
MLCPNQGVMHFKQFLHHNHFIIRTNHKLLEWACNSLDVYGRREHWINMLQNFNFKIVHQPITKHSNVDALHCNPIGNVESNEDFSEEIQDIELLQELGLQIWLGRRNLRIAQSIHNGTNYRRFRCKLERSY